MEKSYCPCCGKEKALGLFEKTPRIELPLAVQVMIESHQLADTNLSRSEPILACGRFFLPVSASLPLHQAKSPVSSKTWIEVDEAIYRDYLNETLTSCQGRLAADIAGFPGSIGAEVECSKGSELEILKCADKRLSALPRSPDHQDYVRLYRQAWGNTETPEPANHELRQVIVDYWQTSLKRKGHRHQIEPPPFLAGIDPAQVMILPPLDTGEKALLSTIGCAEAPMHGTRLEVVSSVYDPSSNFINSFGEFAYLSRVKHEAPSPEMIITEKEAIPGTKEMSAWLLRDSSRPGPSYRNQQIKLLKAAPLTVDETAFAAQFGGRELIEALDTAKADLSDLGRNSIFS
jgi:hypothetical protein